MKRLAAIVCFALLMCASGAEATGIWYNYTTTGTLPFAHTWANGYSWCGQPVAHQWRGRYGVYHQTFQHCEMRQAAVTVRDTRPTPIPTPAPPSNHRTVCASGGNCGPYEVDLINAERASHGIAPLAYDPIDSTGNATCAGAFGHSQAMAQSGTIWHVNAAYPAQSFPTNICGTYFTAGQNVASTPGNTAADGIDYAMSLYLSEPWSPGCSGSHHCNIDSPGYGKVGIGTVFSGGVVWDTQDFTN